MCGGAASTRSCSGTDAVDGGASGGTAARSEAFRALPSVDLVLRTPEAEAAVARFGRAATVAAARRSLDAARTELRAGKRDAASASGIVTWSIAARMWVSQ